MPISLAGAQRSLARQLAVMEAQAGFQRAAAIPHDMTFTQWVEGLAARGLKVDQKPFTLKDRPALRPIYDAIPSTIDEASGRTLVVMKATQLGLTVWEMLADMYMALKFGPISIGMFLPSASLATTKSTHRFLPIARSHPDLYSRLTYRDETDGTARKIGEGNVLTREFAQSLLMFLWTSGAMTTESRPMDVVSLDEVQGMPLDDIDKVQARMGDSRLAFTLMLSTANMPDLDIHNWYQRGTQEVWHTRCDACGTESDLSDPAGIFPNRSTAWNTGQVKHAPKGAFVWTCPACAAWIKDPQQGRYIAQAPQNAETGIRSFLLPRTISPRLTPRQIVTQFAAAKTGDQKKSFYNRTLARPYLDPSQVPVTLANLEEAARRGMEMGLRWLTEARGTYMGVDQMGGWNAVIIKRRLPDGRQAVVHCEAIHDADPFKRTGDLMRDFGVAYCVVEQLPNVNDARRFANEFPGKVYLAGYADLRDDMMVWGDDMSRSDRRTAREDRTRFTVTLSQYKAMQRTLFRLRDGDCLWPDPSLLEQQVPGDDGVSKRTALVRDQVWMHYTKTALVVDQDPDTRRTRTRVQKVGLDPHFSFATMLCDIAWSRDAGGTSFSLVGGGDPATTLEQPGAGASLPPNLASMMAAPPPGTCGACASLQDGLCTARNLKVKDRDPACFMYVARR